MRDLAVFYVNAIEPGSPILTGDFRATLDGIGMVAKSIKAAKDALSIRPSAWCIRTTGSVLACYECLDEGEALTEDRLFEYARLWKIVDDDATVYAVRLWIVGPTCQPITEIKLARIFAYTTRPGA
jgi:hypothetical protein